MDEQDHVAVFASSRVADLPPANVGRLELGAADGIVRDACVDHRAGLRDGRIEIVVGDVRRGDQRDRAADRHVLTDPRDDAAHRPGVGRLQRARDLLRLDVREVIADLDVISLRDDPAVILPSCIDKPHFGIVTGTIRSSVTGSTR